MRINSFTNYAFRILIMLGASPNQTVSSKQISQAYGISANHLKKVASRLVEFGYVKSSRGRNGGLCLAKPARLIVLGEVFKATQVDTVFVECLAKGEQACAISPVCKLQSLFVEAQQQFVAVLERYTLEDLLENRDELLWHLELNALSETTELG